MWPSGSCARASSLVLVAMLSACGAAPKAARPAPKPVPDGADEGNAMEVAESIAYGESSLLVHTARMRAHPYAFGITRLASWELAADALGIDPVFDVDRAFITAPNIKSCRSVLVLRHHVDDARIASAFARLVAEKRAKKSALHVGFPILETKLGRTARAIAAPSSGLLVVMPPEQATFFPRFVGFGRLPKPVGLEAWAGWASRTGWYSLAPGLVSSMSMDALGTTVMLTEQRALVRVEVSNATQSGAATDATILTRTLDKMLRVPWIGVPLIDPVPFRSEGDRTLGEALLLPSEVSWLLGMLDSC